MDSLLKSTLQKSVRRGNFSLIGKIFSYYRRKGGMPFVLLRRLPIIVVEDSILLKGSDPLFAFKFGDDVFRYLAFSSVYLYRDTTVIEKFERNLITEQMYMNFMDDGEQLSLFSSDDDGLLVMAKRFANRYIKKEKGDYKIFVVMYDNVINGLYGQNWNDYVMWLELEGKDYKIDDFEPVTLSDLIEFPYGADFHVYGDSFVKLVAKKLSVSDSEAKRLIWAVFSSKNDKICVIKKERFDYVKFYGYDKVYSESDLVKIEEVIKDVAVWFIKKSYRE